MARVRLEEIKKSLVGAARVRSAGKYLRIGPKKVRVLLDLIRYRRAKEAAALLENLNRKSARFLLAVLNSGIASARQKKLDEEKLFVAEVFVDGGPTFKRTRPRSMGRADVLLKRTSHITVELAELPPVATEAKAGR